MGKIRAKKSFPSESKVWYANEDSQNISVMSYWNSIFIPIDLVRYKNYIYFVLDGTPVLPYCSGNT